MSKSENDYLVDFGKRFKNGKKSLKLDYFAEEKKTSPNRSGFFGSSGSFLILILIVQPDISLVC